MAGALPPSPRLLEQSLRESVTREHRGPVPVRIVRIQGRRAIVEVPHWAAAAARRAWNPAPDRRPTDALGIGTVRTYGTLLKAKAWLMDRSRP